MNDLQGISDIVASQLTDPFRIGLIAALLFTTMRNAAATGWALPLAAGVAFVAYIIAVSFPVAGQSIWLTTAAGLVSNSILAGVMLAVWRVYNLTRK